MDLNNYQSFKALRARRSGRGDVSMEEFSRIKECVEARNWQGYFFQLLPLLTGTAEPPKCGSMYG